MAQLVKDHPMPASRTQEGAAVAAAVGAAEPTDLESERICQSQYTKCPIRSNRIRIFSYPNIRIRIRIDQLGLGSPNIQTR
jgi:hypothetical protein